MQDLRALEKERDKCLSEGALSFFNQRFKHRGIDSETKQLVKCGEPTEDLLRIRKYVDGGYDGLDFVSFFNTVEKIYSNDAFMFRIWKELRDKEEFIKLFIKTSERFFRSVGYLYDRSKIAEIVNTEKAFANIPPISSSEISNRDFKLPDYRHPWSLRYNFKINDKRFIGVKSFYNGYHSEKGGRFVFFDPRKEGTWFDILPESFNELCLGVNASDFMYYLSFLGRNGYRAKLDGTGFVEGLIRWVREDRSASYLNNVFYSGRVNGELWFWDSLGRPLFGCEKRIIGSFDYPTGIALKVVGEYQRHSINETRRYTMQTEITKSIAISFLDAYREHAYSCYSEIY